jgi:hypothetical protein
LALGQIVSKLASFCFLLMFLFFFGFFSLHSIISTLSITLVRLLWILKLTFCRIFIHLLPSLFLSIPFLLFLLLRVPIIHLLHFFFHSIFFGFLHSPLSIPLAPIFPKISYLFIFVCCLVFCHFFILKIFLPHLFCLFVVFFFNYSYQVFHYLLCTFEKTSHIISILGHCLKENQSWEPRQTIKKVKWPEEEEISQWSMQWTIHWHNLLLICMVWIIFHNILWLQNKWSSWPKDVLFKCQACENAHVFHYNWSFLPTFIFLLEIILMQLGEEGGFDDQVVSFYTFGISVSFFWLYLTTSISYASFIGFDSTLG